MAQAGIASRRACEKLIKEGRVTVNGKKATLGQSADATKDRILVNGNPITPEEKKYFILHKPRGYVTTVTEKHGMKTVMDLIKSPVRVYPVGRLDIDSEGLILLTNDGDLANKLTHPRYHAPKEYHVTLDRQLSATALDRLKKGIRIEGRTVNVDIQSTHGNTILLRIHEGRKHIVKRIFSQLGYTVTRLIRTAMGPLRIGNLAKGKSRELSSKEVEELRKTGPRQPKAF